MDAVSWAAMVATVLGALVVAQRLVLRCMQRQQVAAARARINSTPPRPQHRQLLIPSSVGAVSAPGGPAA